MGNSRTVSVNYKPRMTDLEAYDLLWPNVRQALATCPFEYGALWALNSQRKYGERETIRIIKDGAAKETRKGFMTTGKGIGVKRQWSGVREMWTQYRSEARSA